MTGGCVAPTDTRLIRSWWVGGSVVLQIPGRLA
jgi:hypothetical protein